MFFLLCLLLVATSYAGEASGYAFIDDFKAHFHNSTEKTLTISELLDVGHQHMLSLNAPNPVFTPADAAALDLSAEKFMKEQWGYNFSLGNPLILNNVPYVGTRLLLGPDFRPLAMWAPFAEIEDDRIKLAVDLANPGRARDGNFRQNVFSVLCIFLRDTVAPGGRRAGATIKYNDGITFGFFIYKKLGVDLRLPNTMEFWDMWSSRSGRSVVNEDGNVEYKPLVTLRQRATGKLCQYVDVQFRNMRWDEWGFQGTGTRWNADTVWCPSEGGAVDDGGAGKRSSAVARDTLIDFEY